MPRLRPQPVDGALRLEDGMSLLDDLERLKFDAHEFYGDELIDRVIELVGEGMSLAWREAVSALPEDWEHISVRRERAFGDGPAWYYVAEAGPHADTLDGDRGWSGRQESPTAALRALATKLETVRLEGD